PHNNPDPDAIAAAFALAHLARKHFNVAPAIFYGGVIGRAENRAFIAELRVPMKSHRELDMRKYRTLAVVDTQPGAGNLFLPRRVLPTIVIDHHRPVRRATHGVPFADVRVGMGSTSTILTEYLRAAGDRIPKRVATALLWGIKTDTYDLGREATAADLEAYRFLLERADHVRISRIERPLVTRQYFAQFYGALETAEIHEDVLISVLPCVPYPDVTAEVADWFYRLKGVRWIMVVGVADGGIYFSVRTRDRKRDASKVVRRLVGREGSAGGHGMIAGGSMPFHSASPEKREEEIRRDVELLKRRFLRALKGRDDIPAERIIAES
ncbi:MAG: DHH family phosphoesterase, partial [bacterium]